MQPLWEDLANEFNKRDDQEVVIAKVNCAVETDICSGIYAEK